MSSGNGIFRTGLGRVGAETVDAPFQPKDAAVEVSRQNHSPPNQPVSDRFPALEKQEVILSFLGPEARVISTTGVPMPRH